MGRTLPRRSPARHPSSSIPERAACEFSVRAESLDELARVRAVVERCARAAAMAAGVEVILAPRKG